MAVEIITTGYVPGASRAGQANLTGNVLNLFLVNFGELVLEAWEAVNKFEKHTYQRTITQGKADSFPVIGQKRDATEHTPGALITGGKIPHNEVEITLDPILVDAAFIPEIDELMNHYELRAPYARQLAESLSTTYDRRCAILTVLAARSTTPAWTDGTNSAPLGLVLQDNDYLTDVDKMVAAMFESAEHIVSNDIGGGQMVAHWRPRQYFLLSQSKDLDRKQWSGSADISEGYIRRVAGINIDWSNHIPSTNITTGNTKYRGDFTRTIAVVSNPMAVGTLNRRGLMVQVLPQPERLGHQLQASRACGHGILRQECAVEIRRAT